MDELREGNPGFGYADFVPRIYSQNFVECGDVNAPARAPASGLRDGVRGNALPERIFPRPFCIFDLRHDGIRFFLMKIHCDLEK